MALQRGPGRLLMARPADALRMTWQKVGVAPGTVTGLTVVFEQDAGAPDPPTGLTVVEEAGS